MPASIGKDGRVSLGSRIAPELYAWLTQEATDNDRSISAEVCRILTEERRRRQAIPGEHGHDTGHPNGADALPKSNYDNYTFNNAVLPHRN